MPEPFLTVTMLLFCASLNRMRGDASWMPSWLRGRALYYVAPMIGGMALLYHPWPVALAFAVAYAFWAVWAWGHILSRVGGSVPDREPDPVERALMTLPGTLLPVFARMLFALPGIVLIAWLIGRPEFWLAGPAFAAAATLVYFWLFRPLSNLDWLRAEVLVGALWGVLIRVA
jgi:hypothetical protein